MPKLRLAFSKLLINTNGKKIDLINHTYKALENSIPHKISKSSNTVVSFLDISIKSYMDNNYLIGFYGYATGEKYKVIDPTNKTISEEDYPTPPFKGEAMFILTEDGHFIIEEKDINYISPEKIIGELENAYRSYAYEMPVNIWMLELSDETNTMIEFIYLLSKLISVEYFNLKHSNPSEKSKLIDDLTGARIDDLEESSSHPKGIDRENEVFENQISHIKNMYGRIKKVVGKDSKGYSSMELKDDNIRLTVTAVDSSAATKFEKMVHTLKQVRSKLTMKD